ncbi:hypothetical protein CRYUN_Cryun07bG0043500 [Craigia yunnanensis]
MDNLTTFCSSSSPCGRIGIEKTAIKQVWSYGYCSFNRESISKIRIPSPPLISANGTTKKKIEKPSLSSSSTEMISLCGIILSLVILNLVIILQDFYSSFHCIVKFFQRILSFIWTAWSATATAKRPIEKCCTNSNNINVADQIKLPRDQTETNDHRHLFLLELKKMIERISLCNLGSCEIHENLSADKIAGLFEEEEPSLKEVKEAFDLFDENKDGFIDAKELGNVLFSLGFMEASEEDCKKMIKEYDDNLDGRIDFNEFIKVMEKSFC